jgi:hypothetical protein
MEREAHPLECTYNGDIQELNALQLLLLKTGEYARSVRIYGKDKKFL